MQKRDYYYSQIALLIIGVPTLLTAPVFLPIYAFVIYAFLGILFGVKAAEFGPLYYGVAIVFVLTFVVIPALSLLLRKRGSERVYLTVRKLCNVILTVFATAAACCIVGVIGGQPVFLAWQWCVRYGSIPFAMLLFLVPALFIFFCKISLRLPKYIGNTALIISSLGLARVTELFWNNSVELWGIVCLLFAAFVMLWFFEQVLRNKDGRLDLLSRITLTVLSSLSAIVTATLTICFAYVMITGGFSWADLNSLLFAISVFALFVAYIVKLNRGKK